MTGAMPLTDFLGARAFTSVASASASSSGVTRMGAGEDAVCSAPLAATISSAVKGTTDSGAGAGACTPIDSGAGACTPNGSGAGACTPTGLGAGACTPPTAGDSAGCSSPVVHSQIVGGQLPTAQFLMHQASSADTDMLLQPFVIGSPGLVPSTPCRTTSASICRRYAISMAAKLRAEGRYGTQRA